MKIESLIGETLLHKSFGNGVIKEAYDKYLEVEFPEKKKQSKFMYPSCFDGYATLQNKTKQKKVQADLEQWKKENGVYVKEELIQEYKKTQQAIRDRQTAAEERKLKAARRAMEHRTVFAR